MTDTRIETSRLVDASPSAVFDLLCDPQGHVAIDASGMLQSADGDLVTAAGDSFVVHMDREALGDMPQMGKYDVEVVIRDFERDRLVSWTIIGTIRPPLGHVYGYRLEPAPADVDGEDGGSGAGGGGGRAGGTLVTSFYDWSDANPKWAEVFPVISEANLKATLGILDRTVRRGYPRP